VLENSLSVRDELTLNPPIELLRAKFMEGKCLYQNCREGLVHKSVVTVNDVHFRETEARAGRGVWTLCPFCMGWELQQRHECLVTVRILFIPLDFGGEATLMGMVCVVYDPRPLCGKRADRASASDQSQTVGE